MTVLNTPVAILITAGTSASQYTVETGSARILAVAINHEQASTGDTIDSVTFGGVALTKLGHSLYQISGSTAYSEVWYLPETSIPSGAQSLVVTGTASLEMQATFYTLGNMEQSPTLFEVDGQPSTVALSATVATSVGDVVIAAACYVAGTASFDPWGNSFIEVVDASFASGGSYGTSAYKIATGSSETATVDSSAASASNEQCLIAAVFPAATGVSVDSITDPVTNSLTLTLSEASPTVDTIEITYGGVTQTQSFTTADNTTFVIANVTRNLLPPTGIVTVTLKAGVTEIVGTTTTLDAPNGYEAVTVGTYNDTESSVYFEFTGSTPASGDQLMHDDPGNTTITSSGILTQLIPRTVTVIAWDESEEAYGLAGTWKYAGSKKGLNIIRGMISQPLSSLSNSLLRSLDK